MQRHDDAGPAMRGLAVAAIALAGFFFSLTPAAGRLDGALLDLAWRTLRKFDTRPAPDDIVIVGIDEATIAAIPEPPALWHASLGKALSKIAATKPRAIALAFPLPDRSYDAVKPGLDRALFDGLATAVEAGPFVAALAVDARTRAARTIHTPYLALLGESRLGLDLTARDADGVARRFTLAIPTEDGGFPTLQGRLCRQLGKDCAEGLVDYALGKPYTYVPLQNLLAMEDETLQRRLFRDRIVLLGEARAFHDRVDVPLNLAAWEVAAPHSPGIVVQAQTLRTALAGAAPREVSRPLVVLLLSLGALVFLVRDPRMAGVTALLAAVGAAVGGIAALRTGAFLPLAAILATIALALLARAGAAWRAKRVA